MVIFNNNSVMLNEIKIMLLFIGIFCEKEWLII